MSHDRLTIDGLMEAVRSLGPIKRHRIIVGFPLVEPDEVVYRDADGLTLMGVNAYAELRRLSIPENAVWGSAPEMPTFTGVPIEHYDPNYKDHWELARKLSGALYDMHPCSCGNLCIPDASHGCKRQRKYSEREVKE